MWIPMHGRIFAAVSQLGSEWMEMDDEERAVTSIVLFVAQRTSDMSPDEQRGVARCIRLFELAGRAAEFHLSRRRPWKWAGSRHGKMKNAKRFFGVEEATD